MKKAGGIITIFLLFLLSADNASAETTINEGQSSTNIRVNTQTDGGTVSTHIETTVNGKTQIVESHEEGEIIVENKNGEITVKKSTPNTTVTNITKSPTPTDSQQAEEKTKEEFKKSIIEEFISTVENFIKKLFKII